MFYDGADGFKQRVQQSVIALVGKEETWRRHGGEKLQKFGACRGAKLVDVRSNIIDDSQESRINGIQFAFAASDEVVDRLPGGLERKE